MAVEHTFEGTENAEPTALTTDTPRATSEVDGLLGRAWEVRFSDPKGALALCKEALEEAQRLTCQAGVALSLYVRSDLSWRLSNPRGALADALAALPYFEALGDRQRIENTLNMLGVIYSELGELDTALHHYLARYHLCEGRGDASEAEALQSLGYIHDYLGNHAESLAYNLKSWQLCALHGDLDGETRLLNNIGYCYYRLNQHEDALEHYRKALASGKADSHLHALLLDNTALALKQLGDLQNALEHQQQSLALRQKNGDKRGISYSLDSLGSIYRALDEADKAQTCLEQSLALKEEVGDQKGEAETLLLLGTLLLDGLGTTRTEALPLLRRALETAARIGNQDTVYAAHKALYRAFKQQGLLAEALHHHEHYCEVKDRVVNEASQRALGSLRVQFETERAEKELEIYRLKNVELERADREKSELLAQLERQAREDALTGLFNRRHADLRLAEEFTRARRFGHALSVAVCDIDNFKTINDTFSHQTGDTVLRTVAHLLKDHLREVDLVARYGGEEFLLLLPETSLQGAVAVCGDLCRKVETHPWDTVAPGLVVTLSVGLADDVSVANHEKLVALADAKLYEAKRSGKNQVRG